MNSQFFVPILNGFRFYYTDIDIGQLSKEEYNEVDFEGLTIAQYCQKAVKFTTDFVPEPALRRVQFQTDFDFITIDVFDRSLSSVQNPVASEVLDLTTEQGYKVYEFEVDFSVLDEGPYKVQIKVDNGLPLPPPSSNDGLEQIAISEWIEVRNDIDDFPNTLLLQFQNGENDFEIFWEGGNNFEVQLIVEALLHKRIPTTTRSFFRNSNGLPSVLSSKFQRKAQADFYNLPPYLHEQLAIGFMCSNVEINKENYVSEEGLGEPQYRARHYLLANNQVLLESKIGLTNALKFSNLTFFIVDVNGDFLVDKFGNNIVFQK